MDEAWREARKTRGEKTLGTLAAIQEDRFHRAAMHARGLPE
jgi:hypothetical protein